MYFNVGTCCNGYEDFYVFGVRWEEVKKEIDYLLNEEGLSEDEIRIERVQRLTVDQFKEFIGD